jgi:hypothetical protein
MKKSKRRSNKTSVAGLELRLANHEDAYTKHTSFMAARLHSLGQGITAVEDMLGVRAQKLDAVIKELRDTCSNLTERLNLMHKAEGDRQTCNLSARPYNRLSSMIRADSPSGKYMSVKNELKEIHEHVTQLLTFMQ